MEGRQLTVALVLSVFFVCFLQNVSSVCVDSKCTTCTGAVTPKCKNCYIGDPDKMSYRGSVRLALPTSGKCTDYNIANCTKYEVDAAGKPANCQECLEGYVLSDNKCLDCSSPSAVENCFKCSKSAQGYTCSECKDGSYLSNGICVVCPADCAKCQMGSGAVECTECDRMYGLKPDKTGCAHCMFETSPGSSTSCDSCTVTNDGQFEACTGECGGRLKDGKCLSDCDTYMPNCEKCEDADGNGTPEKCLECREYYAVSGGNACSACIGLESDCYGCMESDLAKCNQCYYHAWKKQEFWVVRKDGTDCTKCMPKCETCLDDDNDGVAESCTTCLNGTRFFMEEGQCKDCADVQCSECAGEQTCTACMSGHQLALDGMACVSDSGTTPESSATPEPSTSKPNTAAPSSPLPGLSVVGFTIAIVIYLKQIIG